MSTKTGHTSPNYRTSSEHAWAREVWHRERAAGVDYIASHDLGIPAAALMETAGRSVARTAIEWGAAHHTVIVLCGHGNNGGDGLVAARFLADVAPRVVVYVAGPDVKSSPLFETQRNIAHAMSLDVRTWHQGALQEWQLETVVVIDALTGLGFKGPMSQWMQDLLIEVSTLKRTSVIAVDLPSGMDCDQGNADICHLPADITVTFGAPKPIHVLMPAAQFCGQVTTEDIGFTQAAIDCTLNKSLWCEVTASRVMAIRPWKAVAKNSNKYDRGHVLVIGGSSGKTGAPVLAGMAALRTGAGWVSLALPGGSAPPERTVPDELTLEKLYDGTRIDSAALEEFLRIRKVQCIVIGPGWTEQHLDAETFDVLAEFTAHGGHVILDAGATRNAWASIAQRQWHHRLILTPHPGEWTRLNGNDILPTPLTCDGVSRLQTQCSPCQAVLVYKGASPVIVSGESRPALVCTAGTPHLARAGSGDVLTGIIAAHAAIGCDSLLAVARGYTLLARAAVHVAREVGDDSVIATDVIQALGRSGDIF